jgi:hypothetical protein
MSDISLLSHEYNTTSEFSQKLNHALIQLKKHFLSLPGSEEISQEDIEQSRISISKILSCLITQVNPVKATEKTEESGIVVPGSLVSRIRQERGGDIAYFLEDLNHVSSKLLDFNKELTKEDLKIIDYISTVADEQTSKVFRRLMRK